MDRGGNKEEEGEDTRSDEEDKEAIAFMDDRPFDKPKLICPTLRVRGGVGIF